MPNHEVLPADPSALAGAIMAGTLPASAAIGRPDAYPFLTTGANGTRLAFLGSSAKIDAGGTVGVLGAVLYMMPANASGRNACPGATEGCAAACLAEGTGRMSMSGSQRARRRRHAAFYADRGAFLADLHADIAAHVKRAARKGKVPAIRLNGTTDLPWHRMPVTLADGTRFTSLHAAFPGVAFYEYTKMPWRIVSKGLPANLRLTYSLSEREGSDSHAVEFLRNGHGAAVVTFTPRHIIPASFLLYPHGRERGTFMVYPTVDGDAHDARFLDPAAHVVILAAKGRAKSDTSGFVRAA